MKTIGAVLFLCFFCFSPGYAGELHEAALKGNLEKVKEILASHPETVNDIDSSGFQPLIYSSSQGFYEISEYLISKGAGVNEKAAGGLTPLIVAAYYNQKEIIKLLVSKGALIDKKENFGLTPLMASKDLETKKLLCSLGAGKDIDPASIDNGYVIFLASQWFKISLGKEDGIETGDEVVIVKKGSVAARGKVVDIEKSTARASLIEGTLKGLNAGCHIQVTGKEKVIDSIIKGRLLSVPRLSRTYDQGTRETVTDVSEQEAREFFKAIMENDLKTVNKYLVSRPDIVKIRDKDFRTPLHYAIQYLNDKEIAISLIISGANVNAIDRKKSTPLHLAALCGRTEVMEMLISKKAEVNVYDTDNKSPLNYAKTVGNSRAMKILLRNGAKER